MLTWPHQLSDWALLLAEVEPVFLHIALEIARRQKLLVSCCDRLQLQRIRQQLLDLGAPEHNLYLAMAPSDDTWARDHGPITVLDDGLPRLLDFRFNGWGNKYAAAKDDALSRHLADNGRFGDCRMDSIELVLEGGSIESDGAGTLLTTSACLLNPQRNPSLSREQLEARLSVLLGAQRILWLDHGCIEGDDTDGHIDMLARFVSADTLVYQSCDEPDYSCYASLQAMEKSLQALRTRDQQPYQLVPLPWPGSKRDPEGRRLPASYANFLVINGAVLLPVYADPADVMAIQQLRSCFPEREIIPIDCSTVIRQSGSLHCLTMQIPAGVPIEHAAP
jgi:agmatine/peptidylarginine deiminase